MWYPCTTDSFQPLVCLIQIASPGLPNIDIYSRFAFVEYESRRDADDAYHEMHNKRIGRDDLLKIEVSYLMEVFCYCSNSNFISSGLGLPLLLPGALTLVATAAGTVLLHAVAALLLLVVLVGSTRRVETTGTIVTMTDTTVIMNDVTETMIAGTVTMIAGTVTALETDPAALTIGIVTWRKIEKDGMTSARGVTMSVRMGPMAKIERVSLTWTPTSERLLNRTVPLEPLTSAHDELDTAE
jgi:hypothetical protein